MKMSAWGVASVEFIAKRSTLDRGRPSKHLRKKSLVPWHASAWRGMERFASLYNAAIVLSPGVSTHV